MSTERAEGKPVDYRSDLFSLGSVLYAMSSDGPPFRGPSAMGVLRRVCDETPRPIREVNPDLPPWLEDLVARLQAKAPADRFASAREVADVLARRLAELQHGTPLEKKPPMATARRPGRRVKVAAVVLGLLGVAGLSEATGITHVGGTAKRLLSRKGTATNDGPRDLRMTRGPAAGQGVDA